MAQRTSSQSKGKKGRKHGRSKRKAEGKMKPLSLFIRNKITASAYFAQTNQSIKKVV